MSYLLLSDIKRKTELDLKTMNTKELEKTDVDKNTILKEYGKQITAHGFWEYLILISYSLYYIGNDRYLIKDNKSKPTGLQVYGTEDPRIENGERIRDNYLHFPVKSSEIKLMSDDTICISATKDAFIMFYNDDMIGKLESGDIL